MCMRLLPIFTRHVSKEIESTPAGCLAEPAGVGGGLARVGGAASELCLATFWGDCSVSLVGSAALLAAAMPFLAGVAGAGAIAFPFSACLLLRVAALAGA